MPIQLTLVLPIAAELLEHLRPHAAILERAPEYRTELRVFFGLFPADFAKKGAIVIDREEVVWTLRACSLLRLKLRETSLTEVTEETLANTKAEDLAGTLARAVPAYRLLGTLQTRLLTYFPPHTFVVPWGVRTLHRWIARVQDFYGTRQREVDPPLLYAAARVPSDANGQWQVVVHDDPVNLATYVTAAFRLSLGLPELEAKERTTMIDRQGQAMLWRGDRAQAEAFVTALRAWHLRAELTWARET